MAGGVGGGLGGEAESPPMTQSSLFLTLKGALVKEDKKDRCRGGHNYRNVPGTRSISEGRGGRKGLEARVHSGCLAQWVLGAVDAWRMGAWPSEVQIPIYPESMKASESMQKGPKVWFLSELRSRSERKERKAGLGGGKKERKEQAGCTQVRRV